MHLVDEVDLWRKQATEWMMSSKFKWGRWMINRRDG